MRVCYKKKFFSFESLCSRVCVHVRSVWTQINFFSASVHLFVMPCESPVPRKRVRPFHVKAKTGFIPQCINQCGGVLRMHEMRRIPSAL